MIYSEGQQARLMTDVKRQEADEWFYLFIYDKMSYKLSYITKLNNIAPRAGKLH